jgi:hypothetical protein
MICPAGIADYFASEDWTGQITLKFLGKLAFWHRRRCNRAAALTVRRGNQLSSLAVRRGFLSRQDRGALFVVRIVAETLAVQGVNL